MDNTENGQDAERQIEQFCRQRWTWFVGYVKRKAKERRTKKQEENATERAARKTATATIYIAFFTFVTIAVNVETFLVLRRQLREMHDTTAASKQSADAAQSAALTAENTLKASEKSFQVEQRLYLIATIPVFNQPSIVGNQEITANITVVNIGKTPARKVATTVGLMPYHPTNRNAFLKFINGFFAELRGRDEKTRSEIDTIPEAESDLAPGANQFSTSKEITLSPDEVGMLSLTQGPNIGKVLLYYVGVASYTDSYNTLHKTEFCYFYVGKNLAIWHICDNHNTIQ